jgi:hypothetical protein
VAHVRREEATTTTTTMTVAVVRCRTDLRQMQSGRVWMQQPTEPFKMLECLID